MGLLLGASVLTIFELLDLLIYNTFKKYCWKDKSKEEEDKKEKEAMNPRSSVILRNPPKSSKDKNNTNNSNGPVVRTSYA